jgi:hypothetical protein
VISTSPHHFVIKLVPDPGQSSSNHGTSLFHSSPPDSLLIVAVDLICKFPPTYPSEVAEIEIEIKKGLAAKRKEEISALINTHAEENLGAPAIYAIVEAVREWLVDNNVAGQVRRRCSLSVDNDPCAVS